MGVPKQKSLALVSPYAQAVQLGQTIRALREHLGVTQAAAAKRAGLNRTTWSRVESPPADSARRPDASELRAALLACDIAEDSTEYQRLMRLVWIATARGWWDSDSYRQMGVGQQITASVECGAGQICEYLTGIVPGLAQIESYARYRAAVATGEGVDLDAVVAGRMRRQQQITASTDTEYQVVLEALALQRLAAPPAVMAEQLHHLVDLARRPNVSIRVLLPDADLDEGYAPTSPFSIYVHDTLTIARPTMIGRVQQPVTDDREVGVYVELFARLHKGALSDVDSAAFIREAAADMAARERTRGAHVQPSGNRHLAQVDS